MPVTNNVIFRGIMSVSQLADEVLGLSRARVYELIERGALPMPCYDIRSRRPIYTEEQQRQAFEVKRTGIGADGMPVIFYRRNRTVAPVAVSTSRPTRTPRTRRAESGEFAAMAEQLKTLGISTADERSVRHAIEVCFPSGVEGIPEQDILRAVFRHLRTQSAA